MTSMIVFLKATGISIWVRNTPWAWPLFETLHFVGLSMLLGVIGLLDLRLLGYFKQLPYSGLRRMMPVGLIGFILNLVTGLLFFVAAPDQYSNNIAFYWKLLFLIVAGLNALYFEVTQSNEAHSLGAGPTPTAFKVAGAVSLFSWLMVTYWGRMLPFVGNAF